MKELLVATTNPAKRNEVELVLGNAGITLRTLKDFPDVMPAEEIGETFEENAILKARYYFKNIGIPSLADDGGLMVDALGGAPGVHSHRWLDRRDARRLGHAVSDLELAQEIVWRLRGVPREKRTARLGGVVAFWNGTQLLTSANAVEGYITEIEPQEVERGFPYRSVLVIAQFGKLYGELTHDEHAAVNHRRKNLEALKPKILELLNCG